MRRVTALKVRSWVAWNVRRRRWALGLTMDSAAKRAGLNVRHWEKIESQEVYVTLKTLVRLSYALGVEVPDLLNGAKTPQPGRQRDSMCA